MKWITNVSKTPDKSNTIRMYDETQQEAIQRAKEFISRFIVGEPKATEHYTVDQLKGFGMVGLYKKDDKQ